MEAPLEATPWGLFLFWGLMSLHWFKHYNTAFDGQTISELWAENDTETIAFYWTVLEMVSRWESPDKRGYWEGNLSIFWSRLRMKSQRSRKLLTKIAQRFNLALSFHSDQSFQLYVPNWLELQETRGGKKIAKNEQSAGRSKKIEERIKNISSSSNDDGDFDLELLYQKYPRKLGKQNGIQILKQTIKTDKDYQDLSRAIDAYAHYVKKENLEEKFIKHFSTFVGKKATQSWRDWLDAEAAKETYAEKCAREMAEKRKDIYDR